MEPDVLNRLRHPLAVHIRCADIQLNPFIADPPIPRTAEILSNCPTRVRSCARQTLKVVVLIDCVSV